MNMSFKTPTIIYFRDTNVTVGLEWKGTSIKKSQLVCCQRYLLAQYERSSSNWDIADVAVKVSIHPLDRIPLHIVGYCFSCSGVWRRNVYLVVECVCVYVCAVADLEGNPGVQKNPPLAILNIM